MVGTGEVFVLRGVCNPATGVDADTVFILVKDTGPADGVIVAALVDDVVVVRGLSETFVDIVRDAVVDGLVLTISDKVRICSGLAAPERTSILVLTSRIIFSTHSGIGAVDDGVPVAIVFRNGVVLAVLVAVDCDLGMELALSCICTGGGIVISSIFECFAFRLSRIRASDSYKNDFVSSALCTFPLFLIELFNEIVLNLSSISSILLLVSVTLCANSDKRLCKRCLIVSSVFNEISRSGRKSSLSTSASVLIERDRS